jgi:hypothetical protein
MTKTLREYELLVKDRPCVGCGSPLPAHVDLYPHSGGWLVSGYSERQWLSVRCPNCEYDTSLWKLGIAGDVDHLPLAKTPPGDLALDLELSGRAEVDGQ